MSNLIGTTLNDIKNLRITTGDRNKDDIVVIPGLITIQNRDKTFVELMKIADDSNASALAQVAFEKQSKMIIAGGYGSGKKLEITHNAVYDTIVRAVGFSYKQLVRDLLSELKTNIANHKEEMKEVVALERELSRKEKRLEELKERMKKMSEGRREYTIANREVGECESAIERLEYEIEDARELIGMSALSVNVPKNTGNSSERSTISQVAKELRISVRTCDDGDHYTVTHRSDTTKHPKSTGRGGQMTWNIHQWLSTLTPMTPTEPPREIVTGCTDSYFRTVLNKSPYYASYRRGRVTVYPAGINDGQLYLGATPLARIGSHCTTEYLDMVLGPHGYTHTAVMGWERHVGGAA